MREAENYIIRNNYEIQCLLKEDNLKQVIVDAFIAGTRLYLDSEKSQDELERDIRNQLFEEDYLCSFKSILS